MKVLLVHNSYQQKGGEDSVFEAEYELLKNHGNQVKKFVFDNNDIKSFKDKIFVSFKAIYNPNSKELFKNAIRQFRPDIIHVHNLFYLASPSILYEANRQNIPVVLTLHNYRLICAGALLLRNAKPCELCTKMIFPVYGIINRCYQNSLTKTTQIALTTSIHKILGTWKNRIQKFIVLTEFSKSIFLQSSLKPKNTQIEVKPNFVQDYGTGEFNNRKDFFLFVGRLSVEKGIEILLKGFDHSGFKLEIIGDGPLKKNVEKHCQENDTSTYWGFQSKAFIMSKLKTCLALVFPSIWYEGMPITILEAFSTGTPIIASDIGNINAIVQNGYNGFHFKTGDPAALNQKLKEVRGHKELQIYAENARKTYDSHYSPEKNYELLMDIYQKLLDVDKENLDT